MEETVLRTSASGCTEDLRVGGAVFRLVLAITTTVLPIHIIVVRAGVEVSNSMKIAWISTLFLALWIGTAQAQTVVYNSQSGGPIFSITYPDGWSVDFNFDKPKKSGGVAPPPRVVEAMPDDGSRIWLGVWVPPYLSDLQDASSYLQSLEQYILTDVKAGQPDSKLLNGMPSLIIKGTALKDTQAVEWVMAFFQAFQSAVGAALYVGIVEDKKRHQQALDKLIDSIRPIR